MACNLINSLKNEKKKTFDEAVKAAQMEMEYDKTDFIIYEYENKIYHLRKSCWEKDGGKGKVLATLYFV